MVLWISGETVSEFLQLVTEEGRDPDDQTFPVAIEAFIRAQARVGGNLCRNDGDCFLDLEGGDRWSTRSKELAIGIIVQDMVLAGYPLRLAVVEECPLCHGHGTVECDLEHPDDEPVGLYDSDAMEWRRATTALAAMGAGPMVAAAGALSAGMMRQAMDTDGSGDGGDGDDYRGGDSEDSSFLRRTWDDLGRPEWNPEGDGED
jgi:hypothetical protein